MPSEKNISYIIVGCLSALVALFVFGGNVSDNGSRADEVRQQFASVDDIQQSIDKGISDAESTAKQLDADLREAGNAVAQLADRQQTARAIIEDCQRILGQVYARGKEKAATP